MLSVLADMYNGYDWYGRALEVREVRDFRSFSHCRWLM